MSGRKLADTHMQTHLTHLFIVADCISSFQTTGCSHFVNIKLRKAVTDQIIFTHTLTHSLSRTNTHTHTQTYKHTVYCTPAPSWQTVCGPTGSTAYKNVDGGWLFLTICSEKRACLSHGCCGVRLCPWCVEREREREGSPEGPASSVSPWTYTVCRWFSLMCVTLAWRVMEEGFGWEGRGGAGPPQSWTGNKGEDILVLDSWCKHRHQDETVWGQKCV